MGRVILWAAVLAVGGCNLRLAAVPAAVHEESGAEATYPVAFLPSQPVQPDGAANWVMPGYRAEVVVRDLVYPSSVEFDDAGNMYIAEAGFVYGDHVAPARLIVVTPRGEIHYLNHALQGPVTDLLWHDGALYISHRGHISVLDSGGAVRDLVSNLPSFGDHHNNQLTIGPDGMLYFGQGTATNAGVVGVDNFLYQWLVRHPRGHDFSPDDLVTSRKLFTTINPFIMAGGEGNMLARTAPFAPFGEGSDSPRDIEAVEPAHGTVIRMTTTGAGLQTYAWGLRNPFGLVWHRGVLYASNNGFDERGSRPIANATDELYIVERDGWYGWPDFAGGVRITEPHLAPPDGPRPHFILREHPPVRKPEIRFAPHSGVAKLAGNTSPHFGEEQHLFMAMFGPMTPLTGRSPRNAPRSEVVRIDLDTRQVQTFFIAHEDGDRSTSAGVRRPVDVVLAPDGRALYVVDIGAIEVQPTAIPSVNPHPGTGVIWRIVPNSITITEPPANLSAIGRGNATEETENAGEGVFTQRR